MTPYDCGYADGFNAFKKRAIAYHEECSRVAQDLRKNSERFGDVEGSALFETVYKFHMANRAYLLTWTQYD